MWNLILDNYDLKSILYTDYPGLFIKCICQGILVRSHKNQSHIVLIQKEFIDSCN